MLFTDYDFGMYDRPADEQHYMACQLECSMTECDQSLVYDPLANQFRTYVHARAYR